MTALPLDLSLTDLEETRDALGEAILDLTEIGNEHPDAQFELSRVIFNIGAARTSVELAINACADEEPEKEGDAS